jgi:hypothetical protein
MPEIQRLLLIVTGEDISKPPLEPLRNLLGGRGRKFLLRFVSQAIEKYPSSFSGLTSLLHPNSGRDKADHEDCT